MHLETSLCHCDAMVNAWSTVVALYFTWDICLFILPPLFCCLFPTAPPQIVTLLPQAGTCPCSLFTRPSSSMFSNCVVVKKLPICLRSLNFTWCIIHWIIRCFTNPYDCTVIHLVNSIIWIDYWLLHVMALTKNEYMIWRENNLSYSNCN